MTKHSRKQPIALADINNTIIFCSPADSRAEVAARYKHRIENGRQPKSKRSKFNPAINQNSKTK